MRHYIHVGTLSFMLNRAECKHWLELYSLFAFYELVVSAQQLFFFVSFSGPIIFFNRLKGKLFLEGQETLNQSAALRKWWCRAEVWMEFLKGYSEGNPIVLKDKMGFHGVLVFTSQQEGPQFSFLCYRFGRLANHSSVRFGCFSAG